jgi:molybdopterin-guanine dinucleotide biosynthesis protein A
MGRHKALVEVGGLPLLARACDLVKSAGGSVAVSVREEGPVAELAVSLGVTVVFDLPGSPAAALCGIVAGLLWAKSVGAGSMLTIPCDVPLLPADLPGRLIAAVVDAPCAAARTSRGVEPLCAIWRTEAIAVLQEECRAERQAPLHEILRKMQAAFVDCADPANFLNINTPQDVMLAEALMRDRGVAGGS